MSEKEEIKYRMKRLARKFCRRNDVVIRFDSEVERLIKKSYLSAYLLCLHENKEQTVKLEKENAELEERIERMKCCENCIYFDFNEPNYCHKGVYSGRLYVCNKWNFGN